MPPFIDFRRAVIGLDLSLFDKLFRECTPRILVVTDGLNYDAGQGFGLTQFVATLRGAQVHGMTPIVTTASRYTSAGADINGFDFTHAGHGLAIGRYDVVFLFGVNTEGAGDLPALEVEAIAQFMQDGGGVFATGDHETLGAALCSAIPRVRGMRKWVAADQPPHVSNTRRHSTNLSGSDETEEFDDQSDRTPQRLYVNYRTVAGGTASIDRLAHPLMQMVGRRRVLEVFPDHPHEGECVLPATLQGDFPLAGAMRPEWPADAAGVRVAPEMVASSVSHGDGFPTGPTGPKVGLEPKLFGAVAAYDGHRGGVGRVATDATWHHFININLDGTGSGLTGLTLFGADTDALSRIRQYFVNLATWLMPRKVRRCLRYPLVIKELQRFPLFEELDLPRPPELDGLVARRIGEEVVRSMQRHRAPFEALGLADDAFDEAFGPEQAAQLRAKDGDIPGGLSVAELAHAALGGLVVAMAEELESLKSLEDIVPHKTFEDRTAQGARLGVERLLQGRRQEMRKLDGLLDVLSTQVERPR
jgi:hypothetical protein